MKDSEAKTLELLERLHDKYNTFDFIENDPISVPHSFSRPEDIEISGFLAAAIAWGNRKAIVKSARRMMEFMDDAPYDFVMNASQAETQRLGTFVHRTFNGGDFITFAAALRNIYASRGGLRTFFEQGYAVSGDIRTVLSDFRNVFFEVHHVERTRKHLSSIDRGSTCKRLNMYLRWMVRRDGRGVDFGLWQGIPSSALYLPLDVHSGNMSRALGILTRRQNDWRAVDEVTSALRKFDASDPVKYDFSLFGAGIDGFLRSCEI